MLITVLPLVTLIALPVILQLDTGVEVPVGVDVNVAVAVLVAVGVFEGTSVGVLLGKGVNVAIGPDVAVFVGVLEGMVAVAVGVSDGTTIVPGVPGTVVAVFGPPPPPELDPMSTYPRIVRAASEVIVREPIGMSLIRGLYVARIVIRTRSWVVPSLTMTFGSSPLG